MCTHCGQIPPKQSVNCEDSCALHCVFTNPLNFGFCQSIAVTMATDVNAIDFDLHNVTFNVDYQGTLGGSLVEVALTPVVSAALDITLL